jgi:hypothetical protein
MSFKSFVYLSVLGFMSTRRLRFHRVFPTQDGFGN